MPDRGLRDMGEINDLVVLHIGPLLISRTMLTSLGITGMLLLLSRLVTLYPTGRWATAVEAVVLTMRSAVADVVPESQVDRVFPMIATLWLFLLVANLTGLVPGLHAPTGDLSTTAALALMVFFSVHWFGIRSQGFAQYLRHYLTPTPFMLPFHLVSELTRTLALAIRLFGNVMSLEIAAVLVLAVAGFLVPVPLLLLHLIEALVQAYIFGILALLYIAGGLENQVSQSGHNQEMK